MKTGDPYPLHHRPDGRGVVDRALFRRTGQIANRVSHGGSVVRHVAECSSVFGPPMVGWPEMKVPPIVRNAVTLRYVAMTG